MTNAELDTMWFQAQHDAIKAGEDFTRYRFAALVAAVEREKVAHWMRSMGYATGHGDTVEDLLGELRTQEREACAKYVEQCSLPDSYSEACLPDIANELRARGNK